MPSVKLSLLNPLTILPEVSGAGVAGVETVGVDAAEECLPRDFLLLLCSLSSLLLVPSSS